MHGYVYQEPQCWKMEGRETEDCWDLVAISLRENQHKLLVHWRILLQGNLRQIEVTRRPHLASLGEHGCAYPLHRYVHVYVHVNTHKRIHKRGSTMN